MIDPRTLRKGNWVLHNGRERIVEEIGRHGIDLYGDFDGEVYADTPFEELEGIDISPEILIDFGFEEIAGHIQETVAPELSHELGSMPFSATIIVKQL
jgi:hypothetical protein